SNADLRASPKVLFARPCPFVLEEMPDKAAGGDIGIMLVRKVVDFPHSGARHQCERAAGIFDAINILAHRFQDVGQIPCSHDGIIRAPDFRQSVLPRLGRALIEPDEGESALVQIRLTYCLRSRDGGPLLRPVIRGSAFVLGTPPPDYAALHPGYGAASPIDLPEHDVE